jgi:prepilin-type N-terminal cleavage/methylation domain-containing protein
MSRCAAKLKTAGFTLLETLVALAILSLVLGVLLAIFSGVADRAASARSQAFAESLGTSVLARIGKDLPLAPGTSVLPPEDGYRPTVTVARFGSHADQENWPTAAYSVTVTIEWGNPGALQHYSVTTLRLGSGTSG